MGRSSLKNVMRLIDVANNDIGIEKQFLLDLQNSIEKSVQQEVRKPSQTYKPSCMNCNRLMVYQVLGVEPDAESQGYQSIGIAESGTDRHVRIQKAIENIKDVLDIDCEFVDVAEFVKSRNLEYLEIKGKSGMECKLYHKKYNISFMCDGIIKYKSKYFIFEFKTETSDKFYGRQDVDTKHYNQAIAYSLAFGLDDVLFVYENRNTLDKKSFLKHVTDNERQELINRINYCDKFVKENKIPPKQEDLNKRICNYCSYKSKCKIDN